MGTLKDLSVALMVMISEPWIDPKRDRPKLEALPSGKALLEKIEIAHHGLLATQKVQGTITKEISQIQGQQAGVDKRYDRKLRGLWYVLTGLAELVDTPEEEEELLETRDLLLPDGIKATQRSYAEEAGDVKLAEARLSDRVIGFLKKLPILGGVAWNVVQSWFGLGRELGELDERRKKLEAAAAGGTGDVGISAAEVVNARNYWIRVVRHIETTLELEDASDELVAAILGPLRKVIKDAGRRTPIKADASTDPGKPPQTPGTPA